MASTEDENFRRSFHTTCSLAQMSVAEIPSPISAAAAPPLPHREIGNVQKRALLNIDLNAAPPEDGDSDSPDGVPTAIELGYVEEGEREKKSRSVLMGDSEVVMEEKEEGKYKGWNMLLEVAENALLEHQQKRRKPIWEVELGGGTRENRRRFGAEWNDEVAPVVVRSTRGRALAMPNKYRDSVLDAVAELPRHNKNGKSAADAATKRKFR